MRNEFNGITFFIHYADYSGSWIFVLIRFPRRTVIQAKSCVLAADSWTFCNGYLPTATHCSHVPRQRPTAAFDCGILEFQYFPLSRVGCRRRGIVCGRMCLFRWLLQRYGVTTSVYKATVTTLRQNSCSCVQGDHSPGKPGKHGIVRELDSGKGKVRENGKSQGKLKIIILQLRERKILPRF